MKTFLRLAVLVAISTCLARAQAGVAGDWMVTVHYKVNASEAAMLLGFAVKYDVADLVGTQVSIAAKMPRTAIAHLVKK
jgi:hypothetical protein